MHSAVWRRLDDKMFLRIIFVLLLISCSTAKKTGIPLDQDFEDRRSLRIIGKEEAMVFLDQNYERLKSMKLHGLKEKAHYQNKIWPDRVKAKPFLQNVLDERLTGLYRNFDVKIKTGSHDFYIKDNGAREVLIYFPAPHSPQWGNTMMLERLLKEYPDRNILYVDNNHYVYSDQFSSLTDISLAQEKDMKAILNHPALRGKPTDLLVICYGMLFLGEHLKTSGGLYRKLVVYSPPMKNIIRNRVVSPSDMFVLEGKTFPLSYFVHLHNLIYDDTVYVYPVNDRYEEINLKLWDEIHREYERGFVLSFPDKSAIISASDEIIPKENNGLGQFPVSQTVSGKHFEVLFVPEPQNEFIRALKKVLP